MARTTAFQRSVCAIKTGTPAALSTRTIWRAAAAVGASGFSTRNGLRAAATAAASAGCSVGGTTAITASTAGSATSAAQSSWKRQPRARACSRPLAGSRRERAASVSSGTSARM